MAEVSGNKGRTSPYNDDLQTSADKTDHKQNNSYPSISVVSEPPLRSKSESSDEQFKHVDTGGPKTTKKADESSIEIVDLKLGGEKPSINKIASEGGCEANQHRNSQHNNGAHGNLTRSIESSQEAKKSHRFNRNNDMTTLTDPHNQSVVFQQDKLLEPSKDRATLEPSIDFQPEQKVQKSKRNTGRGSQYNRNKSQVKNKRNADLPQFLEEGQEIGCKCDICKQHLNIIKMDGLDPRILDLIKQKARQEKFLGKQVICDKKMKELYQVLNTHVQDMKQSQAAGEFVLQKGMIRELKRIKDTNAIKFNKGDHFAYEEQNYSWLIQKLAGTNESTYMGCPVNIPETVLFINGKPNKVLRTTKEDDCINQTKGSMSLLELRKYLLNLSIERNKDYQRKLQQMKFEQQALLKRQALERAKLMSQGGNGKPSPGQTENNQASQGGDFASNRSRMQSQISVTSRDSGGKSSSRQESQQEIKQKRDAFLLRFKKDAEYFDKVIQEAQLFKEMDRNSNDKYWQEISSVSLTPIAKIGLGKLYTFDFISPCFERQDVPLTKEERIKRESMSFYGDVRFDFRQFGKDDEALKRFKPLQFCLKMCHVIGFYLKYAHGYDLLKMKVDFNQDEFGEFWLMNVDNLFVRKSRNVPSNNGTQLADYVLFRMQEMEKLEAQRKRAQAKKDAQQMVDSDSENGEIHNKLKGSQDKKGAKSMTEQNSKTKLRRVNTINEGSPQRQNQQEAQAQTLFRKNHPQYFGKDKMVGSTMYNTSNKNQFIPAEHQAQQALFKTSANFMMNDAPGNPNVSGEFEGANESQMSRATYQADSDSVHKINQLKELRFSLKKLRNSQLPKEGTTQASLGSKQQSSAKDQVNNNQHQQYQEINSYIASGHQQKQSHKKMMQQIGDQYQNQNASGVFNNSLSSLERVAHGSLGFAEKDIAAALTTASVQQQSSMSQKGQLPYRSQQKSLKEIERNMQESMYQNRDCNEFEQDTNKRVVQGLKTFCPILRKDNVIRSVQSQAKRHQNFRKSHFYHMKSFNGVQPDSSYIQKDNNLRVTKKNTTGNRSFIISSKGPNATGQSASGGNNRNKIKILKSQNTKNSNSLRESTEGGKKVNRVNPFASGEALEMFEQRVAQRSQLEGDPITRKFDQDDFADPKLRNYTEDQRQFQNMQKVLFNQQLDIKMRCDFMFRKDSSRSRSVSSAEDKKEQDHPMSKYKQMTQQFTNKQMSENEKLAKNYKAEMLAAQHLKEMQLLRSPTQQQSKLRSIQLIKEDSTIVKGDEGDSVVVGLQTGQPRSGSLEQPIADVVTNLNAEDFEGRQDSKARHLAQFILFSKEQKTSGNRSSASKQGSRAGARYIEQGGNRRNLVTSFEALPASQDKQQEQERMVYSCDEDPDVVTQPLYKSFNAWPYATSQEMVSGSSSQRKIRQQSNSLSQNKPMSNQKARAIVQQDYYMSRQGQTSSSHKSLTKTNNRSHNGTAASTQLNGGPIASYDARMLQTSSMNALAGGAQNFVMSQGSRGGRVQRRGQGGQSYSNNAPRSGISSLHHMHKVAASQQVNQVIVPPGSAAPMKSSHTANQRLQIQMMTYYGMNSNSVVGPMTSQGLRNSTSSAQHTGNNKMSGNQSSLTNLNNNRNNILNILAGHTAPPQQRYTANMVARSSSNVIVDTSYPRNTHNQTQLPHTTASFVVHPTSTCHSSVSIKRHNHGTAGESGRQRAERGEVPKTASYFFQRPTMISHQ